MSQPCRGIYCTSASQAVMVANNYRGSVIVTPTPTWSTSDPFQVPSLCSPNPSIRLSPTRALGSHLKAMPSPAA